MTIHGLRLVFAEILRMNIHTDIQSDDFGVVGGGLVSLWTCSTRVT